MLGVGDVSKVIVGSGLESWEVAGKCFGMEEGDAAAVDTVREAALLGSNSGKLSAIPSSCPSDSQPALRPLLTTVERIRSNSSLLIVRTNTWL